MKIKTRSSIRFDNRFGQQIPPSASLRTPKGIVPDEYTIANGYPAKFEHHMHSDVLVSCVGEVIEDLRDEMIDSVDSVIRFDHQGLDESGYTWKPTKAGSWANGEIILQYPITTMDATWVKNKRRLTIPTVVLPSLTQAEIVGIREMNDGYYSIVATFIIGAGDVGEFRFSEIFFTFDRNKVEFVTVNGDKHTFSTSPRGIPCSIGVSFYGDKADVYYGSIDGPIEKVTVEAKHVIYPSLMGPINIISVDFWKSEFELAPKINSILMALSRSN